jgi:hypothetical protein
MAQLASLSGGLEARVNISPLHFLSLLPHLERYLLKFSFSCSFTRTIPSFPLATCITFSLPT